MYIVGAIHSCTEEEREDNICKRTIVFLRKRKKRRRYRRGIFGEGKYLMQKKGKMEKEKEGNIRRRKIFLGGKEESGEQKGEKYLEKENI